MAAMMITAVMACQSVPGDVLTGDKASAGTANITISVTQPQDESIVRTSSVTVSGSASATSIMEVRINGISVNLENNRFLAIVELETGPNTIEVLARDKYGRETSKNINVVYVP